MNPERIYHVSKTQLSVTRFYGGCKYNGDEYIYIPDEDILVRADVFKKERRAGKRLKNSTPQMRWSHFLTASDDKEKEVGA